MERKAHPCYNEEEKTMKWCKQGKAMSETRAHILVIDDDPSILEMMRMILESEGNYRVTTAALVFDRGLALSRTSLGPRNAPSPSGTWDQHRPTECHLSDATL
jgi:hypothetical protein